MAENVVISGGEGSKTIEEESSSEEDVKKLHEVLKGMLKVDQPMPVYVEKDG